MNLNEIAPINGSSDDINVVIEIPAQGSPVKYEIDKDSGAVEVDRFMSTPMFYPANYGFIPNTLADDGDPTDVLVITPQPLIPGSMIRCRPVGVLEMSDEGGIDAKVIAVAHSKLTPLYNEIQDIDDVDGLLKDQLKHFFERYKDLEPGKWVKVDNWANASRAKEIIQASIEAVAK